MAIINGTNAPEYIPGTSDFQDFIFAYGGDDTVEASIGEDFVFGGSGDDELYSFDALATFDFFDGDGSYDELYGESGDDLLGGDADEDYLDGGSGDDWLIGNNGNDSLYGGTGSDYMEGGSGSDTYNVDSVNDVVDELGGAGTDFVASTVNYTLGANVENLSLFGAAVNATGNSLNNVIGGNANNNRLVGQAGNDSMLGGAGNDTLVGGAGADTLIGGSGNDVFDFDSFAGWTAAQRDTIRIGTGSPAFLNPGPAAGDRIDLSGVDANANIAGNQAFILGGVGIGRISLVNNGADTIVRANVNGSAAFEWQLEIEDGNVPANAYTAADFIL